MSQVINTLRAESSRNLTRDESRGDTQREGSVSSGPWRITKVTVTIISHMAEVTSRAKPVGTDNALLSC